MSLEPKNGPTPMRRAKSLEDMQFHLWTLWEASRHPGGLPTAVTLFVGRQPELAALAVLLANPNVRLLSVVGQAAWARPAWL